MYSIQRTTNLSNGFASVVQSNIVATPPTNTFNMPVANATSFYRLVF